MNENTEVQEIFNMNTLLPKEIMEIVGGTLDMKLILIEGEMFIGTDDHDKIELLVENLDIEENQFLVGCFIKHAVQERASGIISPEAYQIMDQLNFAIAKARARL